MAKLSVILGSTRQQRLGKRVASWVMQAAEPMLPNQVELIDLRDLALPWYDEPKTPDELKGKYHHPAAQLWYEKIVATEKLIFITPEYNHSYPGVLKNAIDYMFSDWKGKPYLIVSYSMGGYGGVRAAMQLRGLLDYMGLDCQGELNIPLVDKTFSADGVTNDKELTHRLQKLLTHHDG